jgi:glycosyltransferase involved in cell wall biosynthesis
VTREPLVSVAMATCEGERFLAAQLDSLLAQSWGNLEIVVSDDLSTDRTWEILQQYAGRGRVRILRNERRLGIAKNFENAVRACTGELIALSDQDDIWKPEKIRTLVGELGDFSLIYGRVEEVLGANGEIELEPVSHQISAFARRNGTGRAVPHLLSENWVVSHSLLFRRSVLDLALPFPESYPHHDWWLALTAATQGGIRFLDRSLQLYRRHSRSATYRSDDERAAARDERRRGALGGLRRRWAQRSARELRRLADTTQRLPLLPREKEVVDSLASYFRCGVESGNRWRSAVAGLKVARLTVTQQHRFAGLQAFAKCLLAGR